MADKDQILKKMEALPEGLREAIFSVSSENVIEAVAKKYGLQIDKAGELADEVGLLMLGITNPKDFVANLAKRLGTDPATTKEIAGEINTQIFSKVKDSLKKIHGVGEEAYEKPLTSEIIMPAQPATKQPGSSPFEQKLEEKVFKPASPTIVKEVEEARKENRYPQDADPYKEPPKQT